MPFLAAKVPELTLDDILVLEDTRELMAFEARDTGVPMWPLVRIRFLRQILGDLLFSGDLAGQRVTLGQPGKAFAAMGRYVLHNTFSPSPQGRITLMSTALGGGARDGRWFNRLTDHFAMAYPDISCVVEDDLHWHYPGPRHFERIRYNAPSMAWSVMLGKTLVRKADYSAATALVDLVNSRARDSIGWEMAVRERHMLIGKLAEVSAALPATLAMYGRLFGRLGTRLLLKGGGCYGGASVAPIVAARRMGIVTAEHQHGLISKGMDAYNIGSELAGSEAYKSCLPDYLLTFGPWWNDKFRLPVVPVAIGSPHRSAVMTKRSGIGLDASARRDVLVLSDGVDADIFIDLAAQIAEALTTRRMRVVFRPHPVERDSRDWRGQLPTGVVLDENIDLYDSFDSALAVVSEVTTGAFEALGLVPHILVRDTAKTRFNYPDGSFALFRTIDDLLRLLDAATEQTATSLTKAIWADNWQDNYARFLQAQGVGI
ncbi:hypothetical protein [Devosia ginsengisoli]|uniref:Uncharacterized protein n=1 Tax=Devosia ginsengisoli TaxID=400770 RepID=A0A5B8LW52_9HYPH|nr:hypothetical protein [Devosia ginsengisoli]QDZ11640.1 hypothetical protein FPZ08_13260 [Devosia ginsengisoli]